MECRWVLLHEILLKAQRHPNNEGKTMQILIAHTSKTGNTAQVATYLTHALEARGSRVTSVNLQDASATEGLDGAIARADVVLAGFWTDKGDCTPEMTAFLERLAGKRVFLFGTAGFGGSQEYFGRILANVRAHVPQDAEVMGEAMCSGKMEPQVRERYVALLANDPEDARAQAMIANFDAAAAHPNTDDLVAIAEAVFTALDI